MNQKKKNEIRCYDCHFRCYCGKAKQEKAMEENNCVDYHCINMDLRGNSSWGSYFSTSGY